MNMFIKERDELSKSLNQASQRLLERLQSLDVDALHLPYHCQEYFKSSHSTRLFFSIQTSAALLYKACAVAGKMPGEMVVMDYGAGVGTLFLLAGLTGFKKVIYNDHLEDWKISAEKISAAVGITIDRFIVGDIGVTLNELKQADIRVDLIVSRNVLEHIYKPIDFFNSIHNYSNNCLVFSSTTANAANPAAVVKHRRWHAKWEKDFIKKRYQIIKDLFPGSSEAEARRLAKATRGLAMSDLDNCIQAYKESGVMPALSVEGTNTCDPSNGVWFENLLSFKTWKKEIEPAGFTMTILPGFWDTHYRSGLKNILGKSLNIVGSASTGAAIATSPFIYIIAKPLQQ